MESSASPAASGGPSIPAAETGASAAASDSGDSLRASLRRIQPIISTAAVGELDAVVPKTASISRLENAALEELERASEELVRPSRRPSWSTLKTLLPLAAVDLITLIAVFLCATLTMLAVTSWIVPSTFVYQFVAISAVYFVVAAMLGLYPASGISPPAELRQQSMAVLASFGILLAIDSLFGTLSKSEAVSVIVGGLIAVVVMPVARFFARDLLGRCSWWGERAILIGSGRQTQHLARFLKNSPQRGLRPIGVVDAPHRYWREDTEGLDYLGSPDELLSLADEHDATWAIVSTGGRDPEEVAELLTRGTLMPNLLVIPSRTSLPSMWTQSRECGGLAGLHIQDQLLHRTPRMLKRGGDIVLSALALLMLTPVFLVVAALIKVISPGPVFYGQPRIGRAGRRFLTWKLRTMVPNASELLAEVLASDPKLAEEFERDHKLKDDPRIIRGIGHFLRATSLDELPQFWNVLVGEMSLVGPRPIVEEEVAKFGRDTYPLYLRMRPGITGLWQVSGRNNTTYEDRVHLNTYYVRNWSPWLDAYILLRTVRTMLLREGAY